MSGKRNDPLITLNNFEKDVCKLIAKLRYEEARGKNVTNAQVSVTDDVLEPDREGAMAEMAFCKLARVYPEFVLTLGVRSKRAGADFGDVLYKSRHIDVKATAWKNGKLICSIVNPNVDYYALMVGTDGNYRLAGLMASKELHSKERFGLHGIFKRECFKADQEELIQWIVFSEDA